MCMKTISERVLLCWLIVIFVIWTPQQQTHVNQITKTGWPLFKTFSLDSSILYFLLTFIGITYLIEVFFDNLLAVNPHEMFLG